MDGPPCPWRLGCWLNGKIDVLGFQIKGDIQKEATAIILKALRKRPDVAYVLFLIDSYMMKFDQTAGQVDMSRGLEHVPGRKECILTAIYDRARQSPIIGYWVYDRDGNNKPVFHKEIEWQDPAIEVQGRFGVPDRERPA